MATICKIHQMTLKYKMDITQKVQNFIFQVLQKDTEIGNFGRKYVNHLATLVATNRL
jgi:hypothetical protein